MTERNGSTHFRLSALALAGLLAAGAAGCSGDDGNDGASGADGAAGADGLSALVNTTNLAAGHPECPSGGVMIETGLDDNGNGTLDAGEVDNTSYLCSGSGRGGEDATAGDTSGTAVSTDQALTRIATVPLGAEVTGLYLNAEGDMFFNVQHPSSGNFTMDYAGNRFRRGTVGSVINFDFDDNAPIADLSLPQTQDAKEIVRTAMGRYQVLGQDSDAVMDTNTAAPALGTMTAPDGTEIKTSNDPDFNAFIRTGNGEGYLFTNWEDRPGGMSRMHLVKQADGSWYVQGSRMIDFSSVQGTWVNCFGTVSPWQTPLTSEELYFDDTAQWNAGDDGGVQSLAASLGYPTDGSGAWPNPYRYGHIVEITNPASDNPTPVKRTVMGRFSHENSVVMPDERTAYLSDDGTGTVFFKFVADTAGDLSAGTLYAAEATQDGNGNPTNTAFDLTWVELGHATDAEVESWIAEYDDVTVGDYQSGQSSYISDEQVCDWAESVRGTDLDCDTDTTADANPFSDNRPAFLESRKAAAALGATAEFRKMEGVNINLFRAAQQIANGQPAYAYMAMSEFNATMADGTGDIQLDGTHADCGAVYRMELDDQYNITRMEPAVVGGPYDGNAPVNQCSVNSIANPDNIMVLGDGKVIIGEDTGAHENNQIWVYDPSQQFPYADLAVTSVFYENFAGSDLGSMNSVSLASSSDWVLDGNYAYMNGYDDASNASNDWLVSDAIDLSAEATASLEFTIQFQYIADPANELAVYVSTDYNGGNTATDVQNATWTELTGYTLPSREGRDTRVGPIDMDAYAGQTVYVALQYQNSAPQSGTLMRLQNVAVTP